MKYIAMTLGPICRLTSEVRSIKALWASSYFFSYLAKNLIAPFKERKFILPIVNDFMWEGKEGIGRFPDRYLFEALPGDFECLKEQVNKVEKSITGYLAENLNVSEEEKESLGNFVRRYLKIYFFEKDYEDVTEADVKEDCYSILDLLEMQDSYTLHEPNNYLIRFFEDTNLYRSFLVKDAFDEIKRFQALDQLSEVEKSERLNQMDMMYHNYIAIINADGDRMSDTISRLLDEGRSITELSKKLLDFGNDAVIIAKEYAARIIFIGGDDILIFAPIKYGIRTVFGLLNDLGKKFDEHMESFSVRPTLSFGMTVTYKKFPMGEALKLSQEMLGKSKDKSIHPLKNTITSILQKHSGQSSVIEFEKDKKSFGIFLNLLEQYSDQDSRILTSVIHWLGNNKVILSAILNQKDEKIRCDSLKNYFNNSFNEDIHDSMREFLNSLIDYLLIIYQECMQKSPERQTDHSQREVEEKAIEALYAILRFIHFIKTKKDE